MPSARSVSLRLAALLPALLLSGCLGLGGGKPPPTLLRLSADQPAPVGVAVSGTPANALSIAEPEVDKQLAAMRVPVRVGETDIAYLKNAQWVERPARQFRSLLAETVRAGSKGLVFEDDQPVPASGRRLGGKLIDMGYDARTSSVVVRYDALLSGPRDAVTLRRFEAVVPGVQAKPEAVGAALNRAANQVAAEVAAWVG
ncbi:ABC-type transport auxiliary lipoprotein family protein [Novosphingobium sp.]|uniref:ABC-type transport auxiliary lipoprotein family protein n=1 Tax=Novosphingobium sp. TaxID=1874826 RepID=UPI0025E35484|nr:ABC-type transport auxiliary lipoprotein family protein [Novosphingobium sp.]